MHTRIIFALAMTLAAGIASGQEPVLASSRSATFPAGKALSFMRQCSRSTPDGINGSWDVPAFVISRLEADLPALAALKSRDCCNSGKSVSDPQSFVRQYVGIVIAGKKYVYINALTGRDPMVFPVPWHKEPAIMCDGGVGFWGALYDPETREFSALAFNGP